MLENSLFKHYNTATLHETLVKHYGVEPHTINNDDNELYAILKRILTKKELKFFSMSSANMPKETMMENLDVDNDAFLKLEKQCAVKFRRNKLKEAIIAKG